MLFQVKKEGHFEMRTLSNGTVTVRYAAPSNADSMSKVQKACLLARRTIGGFSLFFTILVLVQEIE